MPPFVQILANPAAGGYSRRQVGALAATLRERGSQVIVGGAGDQIDPRATHVCVAGGDGTIRHAALAVARAGRPIAMSAYPLGTVNLLALERGYRATPRDHATRLDAGQARAHWPVRLGDGLFLACASAGPESRVVEAVSLPLKRVIGRAAYVVAAAKLLLRWPRAKIRLEAEGRVIACEAFHVAKGRFFAGRWRLAAGAGADDPRMHVVALATARRRDVLRFWASLLLDRPPEALPFVIAFTCTAFAASANAPLPVQADGDVVAALPIVLQVAEEPLHFV